MQKKNIRGRAAHENAQVKNGKREKKRGWQTRSGVAKRVESVCGRERFNLRNDSGVQLEVSPMVS